jgi:hypothetical protein
VTLNYVTLILDLYDGSGQPLTQGTVTFTPSAVLTDPAAGLMFTQSPVQAQFTSAGRAAPQVSLLATDNAGLSPSGWTWQAMFQGIPGGRASFRFLLPYASGATQYLSSQVAL